MGNGWLDPFPTRKPQGRWHSLLATLENPLVLAALGVVAAILAVFFVRLLFPLAIGLGVAAVYRLFETTRQRTIGIGIVVVLGATLWAVVPPTIAGPSGFLQFDRFEILQAYSSLEAGHQLAVNIYSANPGPTRITRTFGYTQAYVKPRGGSSDQEVAADFEREFAPVRKKYLAKEIIGVDQGIGRDQLWTTAFTP